MLPATAPVREAITAMQAAGVGSVLVTRDSRLVGILTERDALLKVAGATQGRSTPPSASS